jgi:superfamily II DNA or RNA helicase
MMKPGIYEQVINKQLGKEIDVATDKLSSTAGIDPAEASKVLTQYISEVVEKALNIVKESRSGLDDQVKLANKIVNTIMSETGEAAFGTLTVDERAEQLLALIEKENTIFALDEKAQVIRPETSIAQSSLFTGAIHEPSMYTELKKEIVSSDSIDMLVSFIKWSGLRLIIDELKAFTMRGGRLRIITTSYMGATDAKAIEELRKLPNTQIMVSYDTKRTRLHAKTYVFYRETGFTTAYVGSSNLSNAAISSGLEWNVKLTAKDLFETIQKIDATFESYWNSNDFELYSEEQKTRLVTALKAERSHSGGAQTKYMFDITPYPYQQEILDKLRTEREVRCHYKNLVVAATGTGKTVISGFDYRRFCKLHLGKPNRLLFVAHREEILKQSLVCFQGIMKDANFGELFVGGNKPESLDHLFVSVQTFNSQELDKKTSPDFYDYIIIDEFHHAAAPIYQRLLTYYKPKILLGLTATPERMDGKSVLEYFDNRIAAEIRLPEAIDRKLLSPFQYFGVTDTVDLNELRWVRGGYDKNMLSNLYTMNRAIAERRVDHIIRSLDKYVTSIDDVKGLGFCVSKEHARFMAEHFNKRGISSIYLISESPDEERNTAKKRLIDREIKFIFVVDIYNEGVDIPEVNTVLFLRPTESLTIFLQQLGRGLRLAEGKECLTILDFIGQANKKYNFEEKFSALLSNTRHSVQREIKNGFLSVPKGCYVQLERKAKEYILNNIRSSLGVKAGLVAHIKTFEADTGKPLTLANFVDHYHLDPRRLYQRASFSRLCVLAGVRKNDFDEPVEKVFNRAFTRICTIDSRRWINFLLEILPKLDTIEYDTLPKLQRIMIQMFYVTVWQQSPEDLSAPEVVGYLKSLADSPVILAELIELLQYNLDHIDIVDEEVGLGYDCPLDLYCSYSMRQIATAMEFFNYGSLQGIGVRHFPEKKTDVFFVTLNKAEKDYSPTTMYNDYSINEWLFHWQSQSTTSSNSPTGKRYRNHRANGDKILLFVREFRRDEYGTANYTFLGLVDYVRHEGSRPMNIIWKLRRPIPAKYLKKTNKLVVG